MSLGLQDEEARLRGGGRNEQAGHLLSHPQHPGLRGTRLRGLSHPAASPLTPVGDFVRGSSPLTGFPGGSDGKESVCRRPRFDPWVGKTPWRRKQLTEQLTYMPLPLTIKERYIIGYN